MSAWSAWSVAATTFYYRVVTCASARPVHFRFRAGARPCAPCVGEVYKVPSVCFINVCCVRNDGPVES